MARSKHKIGQMIETSETFGRIIEVRETEDGYRYLLDDNETLVSESDVTAAYRPVKVRGTSAKKTGRGGKRGRESEAAAA